MTKTMTVFWWLGGENLINASRKSRKQQANKAQHSKSKSKSKTKQQRRTKAEAEAK